MDRPPADPADPELVLVRARRVHVIDDSGRALEVTGLERDILLGEATAARVLHAWAREPGWARGGGSRMRP